MRWLLLILLITSCATLKDKRDKKKFDRLLRDHPEWASAKTIFKDTSYIMPEINDSTNIPTEPDTIGIKEVVTIIQQSDCPEKDKEAIKDAVSKSIKKPIDTTISTDQGKFQIKDWNIKYVKPEDTIPGKIPVSQTIISPCSESGTFGIGAAFIIFLLGVIAGMFIKK